MVVDVKFVYHVVPRGDGQVTKRKKVIVIKCDTCGEVCDKRFQAVTLTRPYHYCSYECAGAAKKPGTAWHLHNIVERDWGVSWSRAQGTLLKNHGATSTLGDPVLRAKVEATTLTLHGVTHPMQSAVFKQRQVQTLLKNHGVTNSYQLPEVIDRSRSTMQQRYGAPTYMQTDAFKALVATPEFQARRHSTMKTRGNYRSSAGERACYELLCRAFGDVACQVTLQHKRWAIDFYVKSLDTYVQFDGVYWHGLDRPLDVIAGSIKPRDAVIYRKWQTDREQDTWFAAQGLRLVRLTDREFKGNPAECLLRVSGPDDVKAFHNS